MADLSPAALVYEYQSWISRTKKLANQTTPEAFQSFIDRREVLQVFEKIRTIFMDQETAGEPYELPESLIQEIFEINVSTDSIEEMV